MCIIQTRDLHCGKHSRHWNVKHLNNHTNIKEFIAGTNKKHDLNKVTLAVSEKEYQKLEICVE